MSVHRHRVAVGIPTYNRSALLRRAIESVLNQTYDDFQLIVSDNASTDDTAELVASFDDSRIVYSRSTENIGMTANFNRAIHLADADYVALLYDDDLFYPGFLEATIGVLAGHPSVGVVHTGFDIIDRDGEVIEHAKMLVKTSGLVEVESGASFIERSMRQDWMICSPSALFRAEALHSVGCFPVEEEPLPDVPMLRRISLRWNIACVSKPLVAFRIHGDTASATLGGFTGFGYSTDERYPLTALRQRMRFLDEAGFPPEIDRRYRSMAEASYRRDSVGQVAANARSGTSWGATNAALVGLVRSDPRHLLLGGTWRLVAAQAGGRASRRYLQQLRGRSPWSEPNSDP
jgi:hypothetical protein